MPKAAQKVSKSVTTAKAVKDNTGRDLMQAVLARPRNTEAAEFSGDQRITGIVIGTLAGATQDGQPLVHYPGIPNGEPLQATVTGNPLDRDNGQEVALGFVNGDPAMPIILGVIQKTVKPEQKVRPETPNEKTVDVKIDGNRLTLSAEKEIVLQCGKSSITLTRAGKVILKGAYLTTHSTGVNRIKGGSVQIN